MGDLALCCVAASKTSFVCDAVSAIAATSGVEIQKFTEIPTLRAKIDAKESTKQVLCSHN